jgi:hypothetical protein
VSIKLSQDVTFSLASVAVLIESKLLVSMFVVAGGSTVGEFERFNVAVSPAAVDM